MRNLILITLMFVGISASAQDKDNRTFETSADLFMSSTGEMISFIDTKTSTQIPLLYGVLDTQIRVIEKSGEKKIYLKLTKDGQYSSSTGLVELEDIYDFRDAVISLNETLPSDVSANPQYQERKFRTEDYFGIGYYISATKKGQKIQWYLELEKYGSSRTAFIRKDFNMINFLNNAISQMESLK